MNKEKLIFDIIATYRSNTQKGDVSEGLLGHVINQEMYETLQERDKSPTGNSVDVKETFFEQNPYSVKNC